MLIALARTRGWRFLAPGYGDPASDNVHVLARDGAGWYLGFLERGATVVLQRFADEADEADAVAALHQALVRASEAPSAPDVSSVTAGRTTTWSVGSSAEVVSEADLVEFVTARSWKAVTPSHDPGSDNVHVLGRVEEGWRVGYRERGVVDWDPNTFTEEDSVAVIVQRLRRDHTFRVP